MKKMSYAEAIREAMSIRMREDPNVLLFGEDVGAFGGCFGVSAGMFDEFGEKRVRDTPISEGAIIGAAVGSAATGLRPIAELMFCDFLTVGMDQLVNQAAKMRYMFGGKISLPMVVRLPCGAGVGAAAQHSQSLEAWMTHVPGLKVVYPSTPQDALGLMLSSIDDDNPVMFFEHKAVYALKGDVESFEPIPLGKGDIKREGSDVTVIATGKMVYEALAAAEPQIRKAVEGSGIEITGTFWYGGEASRENMDMLRPQVADADMIFAVGGGKAIDTCKVLAHETNRPFFTFPTIASTCASCTSLGIVYHPDGSLREYSFSKIPPNHIFINTEIIANAPARYLWAGMGDTMAKHYECTISSRKDVPAHSDAMGIALSSMCAAPILRWGKQAMADCEAHKVTPELTEIIEAIIISTGYVSNFVQVDYTTGMAHAMYNGFTILPSTEEYHHLHGEVVSYGILVMLTADKQYAERDRLLAFNRSIGLPTHLADIHARPEDLPAVTEKALAGIDVRVWPYPVAQQMLIDAVMELEQVG